MSEDLPFADFISRIRSGDPSAAEELVSRYEPIVRREIRFRMTDHRLAQVFDSVDICQSVWSSFFVRMAAGQFDLDTPKHLTQLLVSMARIKLAFQSRKNRYQKRDVGRLDRSGTAMDSVSDHQPGPSESIATEELFSKLVQSLTAEERQISELRRAGLEWKEVASTLGGTAQGRRMQLDRAADRVTRELGLE